MTMNLRISLWRAVAFVVVACKAALSADGLVQNPQFDRGAEQPEGWTLSGGKGRWLNRQMLEVTGTGEDSNSWQSPCRLAPATLYRFQFLGRRASGSGGAITGPASVNHDWPDLQRDWQWRGHVFRTSDNAGLETLRLGQWHATGTLQFDAVRLRRVLAVHRQCGPLVLGDGESIRGGVYTFHGSFNHDGSNYHRVLSSFTSGFNSNRWSFGGNAHVTYCFAVPGCRLASGRLAVSVNYHTVGACLVEVSRNLSDWRTVGRGQGVGEITGQVPAELLPADTLYARLRGVEKRNSFQVSRVDFEARLDGSAPEATGATSFADLETESPQVAVRKIVSRTMNGQTEFSVEVANLAPAARKVTLRQGARATERQIAAGKTACFSVALAAHAPGEHRLQLELQPEGGPPARVSLLVFVPDYNRADYGALLTAAGASTAVWWCPATHKIPRIRTLPTRVEQAATMSAAGNDHEAVQIVVCPRHELRGLTVAAGTLRGPAGATIPAANVRVLRAYYHFVDAPTDRTGVRDFWPDALPPVDRPLDVAAGQNQPLWVLVHVPADARPGDYAGTVQLKARGFQAAVPLRLHVWRFALPERNHLETAFGLSPAMIFRYHQLKTEADRRRVLDLYFQSFAEHRISTYDLTPLDRIRVKFMPEARPPRAELDFTAFDAELTRVRERFHFTNFRLPIEGMGGGTFQSRREPRIGRYEETTPEYQAMFASYVQQLEAHLRAKGWLSMAYVYWFDEPAPKDFAFVRNGMLRLKKYAPGLARMLTQEPVDELIGSVNLWCPISYRYDHAMAEQRRAAGERFWWYVCCGPKAPYCTLFIDHPATELRIWLWQTWQRGIVGNLVWESNYWTSANAYPDAPQNPYQDPMGYVSDGALGRGVKHYWGNGDGRFLYPPEAAAVPGASGPDPVIAPPVTSLRWEMLREGIEDYEYLYLLRDLVAQRRTRLTPERVRQLESLLEVPPSITRDMTTFTTDPAPLYARRAQIAQAIESLIE
jgi:hypothetical protein